MIIKIQALNIDFPERFPKDISEILNNRLDITNKDSRPLALAIYPKFHSQNSFMDQFPFLHHNQIHDLIKKGYRVIYYEVSQDTEFVNCLREAGEKHKISLLIIGGHGNKTELSFGDADSAEGAIDVEKYYLDIADGPKLEGLSEYLDKDCVIVLDSCSTGDGGEDANNVANMLKKAFTGRHIFAPMSPAKILDYTYDENNRVIGVNYDCGEDNTYCIQ